MSNENITERLKSLMQTYFERNDITQKDYAKRIKIHPKTLSNYVNGYREMPYEILSRIAKDMDIDLNYIFKDSRPTYTLDKSEIKFITLLREMPLDTKEKAYTAFKTLIDIKK